jgi:hypothetical protein
MPPNWFIFPALHSYISLVRGHTKHSIPNHIKLAEDKYAGFSDSYNSSDNTSVWERHNSPFFIKPRIKVDELTKRNFPVSVMGKRIDIVNPSEPENFQVNIWTLKMRNKQDRLSRLVKKCSPKVYVDSIGEEIGLGWLSVQTQFPRWIMIEALPPVEDAAEIKAEYIKHFSNAYAYNKIHRIEGTDIPTGESKEIYFLFTFNESNFAYLIMQNQHKVYESNGVLVDHLNQIPLILQIPGRYNFTLGFEGEQYNEPNGRKLGLHIKSYDDIRLTGSRRWPWQHKD